jgi:P27 family predicted phage terminase small subunit
MQEMGTLATQDLDSIRAYVVFFFRFEDANAVLNKQGTIIETSTGAKVNPAWRIMVESQKELRTLWAAFGLTPADRARIKIEKPKPTTSILDFMSVTKKAQ